MKALMTGLPLFLAGGLTLAQDAAMIPYSIKNPGFEEGFHPAVGTGDTINKNARITGAVADGWSDNSGWAEVEVDYARESVNPYRGGVCQRIEVKRVTSGAVQFIQSAPFKKGRIYMFRVWMRGRPGTNVSVGLRQAGAPYTQYAVTDATLSAEWREFRVFGTIPEDVDGFLIIRSAAPMTFWVDDAGFEDLTEAQSDASPRTGNLIPGGSFEAGMSFGWSVRFDGATRHVFADYGPGIDAATAAHGVKSLRCEIPEGTTAGIKSPLITYNYNRTHTLSLWMKASAPGANAAVQLDKAGLDRRVDVGLEWKRYAFTEKLAYQPYTQLRIYCQAPEGGPGVTLWVDGVQLEERETASAEYLPPFPVEITLDLARDGSVVFDREAPPVRISLAGDLPRRTRLKINACDIYGNTYAVPDVKLPAESFPLPVFPDKLQGVFKLAARVVDSGGKPISFPVELVWARLPRPREIDPAKSYFGLHIPLAPKYFRIARAVGVRRVRLHDTSMIGKWAIAEPKEGKWEFYDEAVTAAHDAGLRILGMLDGAPGWASTKPRENGYWDIWHIPDAPGAIEKWERYVRTVVGHYAGRIDEWEIWNEPWGNWFLDAGGTPELYAKLMKAAYRAAKAANPAATIAGVDTFRGNDEKWTEPVLAASGTDCFDVFSFHDYNDVIYGGPGAGPEISARNFRALQGKYGQVKPLWNTEGSLFGVGSFYAPEAGGMPVRTQPAYIVRYDVCYMAQGVGTFYLYGAHSNPALGEIDTRHIEYKCTVSAAMAARAVLASKVDGAGIPVRSEPVKGVDAYAFPPDRGKRVTVVWSYDGDEHAVPVPRGASAFDVFGNPLRPRNGRIAIGPEPIYLEEVP